MGCCGCDSKTSATTAGIFGLIQSVVGLILNAYFINLYTSYSYPFNLDDLNSRIFLVYATYDTQKSIFILLVIATILHGMWFISSIILLIGNAYDNACCVRQWVVWTSFVIIGDIIMPVVLIICTIGAFVNIVTNIIQKIGDPGKADDADKILYGFVTWASSTFTIDLLKYYIILFMSFFKLSLITIITNICFNVFTDRRASDICKPRGHVVSPAVTIIQGHPGVPGMIQVGPGMTFPQSAFMYNTSGVPQTGTANSISSQNVPQYPGMTFSALQAASGVSEAVHNDSTESLMTTKPNNELKTN